MKTTKALPIIRVERPKAGAVRPHVPSDVSTMDLMLAIVTSGNRVRSRVDGVEARLKYLETIIERQGSR